MPAKKTPSFSPFLRFAAARATVSGVRDTLKLVYTSNGSAF
jgi:hypothetical protein